MNILITGSPGIGKTSILNQIRMVIESYGYNIGGVYTPEIREDNKRIGFSIINLSNKRKGVLASNVGEGPRIGKYKVNLKDLDEMGVSAIEKALKDADFIFIDEIAPMELKSHKFIKTVEKALDSEKTVLGVIHKKSTHPFIVKVKNRDDVTIFEVTHENRESLAQEILKLLKENF